MEQFEVKDTESKKDIQLRLKTLERDLAKSKVVSQENFRTDVYYEVDLDS